MITFLGKRGHVTSYRYTSATSSMFHRPAILVLLRDPHDDDSGLIMILVYYPDTNDFAWELFGSVIYTEPSLSLSAWLIAQSLAPACAE